MIPASGTGERKRTGREADSDTGARNGKYVTAVLVKCVTHSSLYNIARRRGFE